MASNLSWRRIVVLRNFCENDFEGLQRIAICLIPFLLWKSRQILSQISSYHSFNTFLGKISVENPNSTPNFKPLEITSKKICSQRTFLHSARRSKKISTQTHKIQINKSKKYVHITSNISKGKRENLI